MNFSSAGQVITLAISVVFFLGAALTLLRGSLAKGTIVALEANNKALTERVTVLENLDKSKDASLKAQQARIEALERENGILLSQRPSADLIAEISRKLDAFMARENDRRDAREQASDKRREVQSKADIARGEADNRRDVRDVEESKADFRRGQRDDVRDGADDRRDRRDVARDSADERRKKGE